MLWEDLTVVLCAIGFLFTVAAVLLELPQVLAPTLVRRDI